MPAMVPGQAVVAPAPVMYAQPVGNQAMHAGQPVIVGAAGGPAPVAMGGHGYHLVQPAPVVTAGNAGVPMMTQPAPVAVPGGGGGGGAAPPAITGQGATASEVAADQVKFAYENGLFEPQDFKPADDDPSRYYYVREVDGVWTQRNRYTIDNLGDCRWYITDSGYFYAVRLPN
jgi:hypothetical protein